MTEFVETVSAENDAECCSGKNELPETGAPQPTINDSADRASDRLGSATQFAQRIMDASQQAFRTDRRSAIKDLMLFGFGGFALIERFWRDEHVNRVQAVSPETPVTSFATAKPGGMEAYTVAANWRLTLPLLNFPMSSLPASRLPNA